jgi:hypothetical protein
MSANVGYFSILSVEDLGEGLGLPNDYAEDMNEIEKDVPPALRHILHYALAWGIGDDGDRSMFVERAAATMKQNLKWIVNQYEDELDNWLAGPEAFDDISTRAYIAFSNMRMASDEIPYLH